MFTEPFKTPSDLIKKKDIDNHNQTGKRDIIKNIFFCTNIIVLPSIGKMIRVFLSLTNSFEFEV